MSTSEFQVARLRVEPGDVVVVKVHAVISQDIASNIRRTISTQLPPDTPMIVIDKNVDLAVLTKADIEQRLES